MNDNSKSRKKALIVSVLAFLFIGGGVFLFFIIQGANDLTGADKNRFSYGGGARGAASSFFKFLGFDSVEPMTAGVKDRPRLKLFPETADKGASGNAASASASASTSAGKEDPLADWGGVRRGGSASAASVPHMSGAGMSGVGGVGAGGTQSSAGVSRFGEGSDSGAVKVSGKSLASAATASTAKGTLGSLQRTRAMLGDGLRSGSAMTAKAKWDSSFGVGGAKGGKELAYSRGGLVSLDKIKSGEIDNLKTTDPKSLAVPDVPGFKKDDNANVQLDEKSKKAQDAAKDALKSSVMSQMASAAINPAATSRSGGGDTANNNVSCDQSAGPQTAACSAVLNFKSENDTNVSYKQLGKDSNGNILVEANFAGKGPSIRAETLGQTLPYNDRCSPIAINPTTGEIVSMGNWSATETVNGKVIDCH